MYIYIYVYIHVYIYMDLGHGPDQLQVTTGGIAEQCVMGGTTNITGD